MNPLRGFPRPAPGMPGDPGLFGPGSVTWKVNGEAALILGGGRALLMQIAHPSVAAGVADHSDFRADPFVRLWRTMDAMLTIAFGDAVQSAAAADAVTDVHTRVRGLVPGGPPYDALDPALLLWVHATLVDSALLTYRRFVGDLSWAEKERYYEEMKRQAIALRVPPEILPDTLSDFRGYMDTTISSLEVSAQAREIAAALLRPPAPPLWRPVFAWLRAITLATLPSSLLEGFGLRRSRADERAEEWSSSALRSVLPLLPERVRRWPHALEAAWRA